MTEIPDEIMEEARELAHVLSTPMSHKEMSTILEGRLLAAERRGEERERVRADRLAEGLLEAVGCLYDCRYSEAPLARKLDDLLKEVDGKGYAEHQFERYLELAKRVGTTSKDPTP